MPPPPTLLIVTNKADPHADEVIRLCAERSAIRPLRLNTDGFATNVRFGFRWDESGTPIMSQLAMRDSGLGAEHVDVVWWRKPAPIQASPALTDPEVIRVAAEESESLLRSLDAPFPEAAWVNHPQAMSGASRKLRQIRVARELGLLIPETVVTNRGQDVLDFIRCHRRCIIKPLAAGAFMHDGQSWGLFTNVISLEDAERVLDSAELAPVMVQRQVEKHRELRITIIGEQLFACVIETRATESRAAQIDWRAIAPERLPHRLTPIPQELETALRGMLRHYGLNYGAFDVIQEPDGRYWFLELNPNGQYLWVELMTGAPMSLAMVALIETLARGSACCPRMQDPRDVQRWS